MTSTEGGLKRRSARAIRLVGVAVGVVAAFAILAVSPELIGVFRSWFRRSFTYRDQRLLRFGGALALIVWLQWRAGPVGGREARLDGYCQAILGRWLPGLVLGVIGLMAAAWLPHYLTWPWWADTDHFAVSALSWRAGILPYRDLVDYNFPGLIYLFLLIDAAFGAGRTWPFYLCDAAWLAAVVGTLAAWARVRFGSALPGLAAGLLVTTYYMSFPVSDVGQRDWYSATLAVAAILVLQFSAEPGKGARLTAAFLLAASLATRPYALLFLPAVALAAAGAGGTPHEKRRRVAWWSLAFGALALAAFSPLVVFGVFDDFLRSLAYLRPGGLYNDNSFDDFLLRLYFAREPDGYLLAAGVGTAFLALGGPIGDRRAAAVWLLATAAAALYLPLSPVPHGYLRQPGYLVAMVVLGFILGVLSHWPGLRASARLLAYATVVGSFLPEFPRSCNPRASLRAVSELWQGRDSGEVPPGVDGAFMPLMLAFEDYQWGDYQRLLNHLRETTAPKTRVANFLRRFPNPPVNGPVGRLTPFPHASGVLWFRWIGPGLEPEFARELEASDDSVVVWVPGETGIHGNLKLPLIEAVVRTHYRPEARFGVMEVWRRSAGHEATP